MTKKILLGLILCLSSGAIQAQSKEAKCLALAIYNEARGESERGQRSVGEVVLNRINAGVGSTTCEVIYQHQGQHYQFGFIKLGVKSIPKLEQDYFYGMAQELLDENDSDSISLPPDILYFNNIPFQKAKYDLYEQIGRQYFYRRRHRRGCKETSLLKGTRDILIHQNIMADEDGLPRIKDDDQLIQMEKSGDLVKIPSSNELLIASSLPENRRYCREWTADFLRDISNNFYHEFGKPLQVNSAVRTVQIQKKLIRHNSNAAGIEGDSASPHLTGQAVDIAKKGLTRKELIWMRQYLLNVRNSGNIDVEEEFHQSVFHISVYHTYMEENLTT